MREINNKYCLFSSLCINYQIFLIHLKKKDEKWQFIEHFDYNLTHYLFLILIAIIHDDICVEYEMLTMLRTLNLRWLFEILARSCCSMLHTMKYNLKFLLSKKFKFIFIWEICYSPLKEYNDEKIAENRQINTYIFCIWKRKRHYYVFSVCWHNEILFVHFIESKVSGHFLVFKFHAYFVI